MKILNVQQIRDADAYTIKKEPITSINLMERASGAFVSWFVDVFNTEHTVQIFCGIGNNGGDGLAIARLLHNKGYSVKTYIVRYSDNASKDFRTNEKRLEKLKAISLINYKHADNLPKINPSDIIIDALWGSGLSRPIEGFAVKFIDHINASNATIVAVDIPSGLFADSYSKSVKIKADFTLSFELPKLSFMFPENYKYVGEWESISIGINKQFIQKAASKHYYITALMLDRLLKFRRKFEHKGNFGHALIIGGSYGKIGAVILAAKACLRSGAGLTTVYIPKCGYEILQTALPEVMVSTDDTQKYLSSSFEHLDNFNAIAIGPGIDTKKETQNAFLSHMKSVKKPLVIDADGLNILSKNTIWLKHIPKDSILTPHPKEFERLAGKTSNDFERHALYIAFAQKHKVYLILKGGHTAIACPDGSCYFNSTGNPGMATAGSGDVLTGILCGLLAQGYAPLIASILGVYLHGLAGDIAAYKQSENALIATDIIDNLGNAFNKIYYNDIE